MNVKTLYRLLILLWACWAALPLQANAASAGEQTWQAVRRIQDLLRDPSIDEVTRKQTVREVIDQHFSFYHFSRRAVGREWQAFSPVEQEQYIHAFSDLLFHTYYSRSNNIESTDIVFVKELPLGKNRFEVQMKFVRSNGDIPITYRLVKTKGQWRAYDIIVEGISLVSNYRSQFTDILSKGTPADLIQILREKNEGLRNQ